MLQSRWLMRMLIAIGILLGVEAAMNIEKILPLAPDWEATSTQPPN